MIPLPGSGSEVGLLDNVLIRWIDDPTTGGGAAPLGLGVAVVVGAVHALGPGHGKALVSAYLVGARGRARDAVALGLLVAAMHSGSVLLLAFVLSATRQVADSQRIESSLTVIAALGVTAVGAWLLVDRWRNREHHHDGHDHHHGIPEGVAPLSRAGILALAGAGGLLPSPVAFLVLMTALALGRTSYGITLVLAFSVGLAATLTTVGLAVLWGRDRLDSHVERPRVAWLVARLQLGAATVVFLGGLILFAGAISAICGRPTR